LTQAERQAAYEAAQDAVRRAIGPRPARDQFAHIAAHRYPPRITRLITALCIVLLLAAFTPSAIRLFVIGSQTFGQAINNTVASSLVGLATVLCAEIGQMVFSLTLATLDRSAQAEHKLSPQRLLYVSMAVATMIALVGNVQLALPGHTHSPFAWLEAIAPPLLVLSTAYVLKEQMLDTIQQRHANEQAFQAALAAWQAAADDPESHPRWSQFYANALRDALRKANSRRQEALSSLTAADWRGLIYREHQADAWYEPPAESSRLVEPAPLLAVSGNGNGRH
jgi:hypothetical protein